LFKIADTHSSRVLIDILGEDFADVIGCDYFSACRKYMKDFDVLVQFFIAHLVRELNLTSATLRKIIFSKFFSHLYVRAV